MDILKKESIVLKIGDLKLSDTYDTFGEKRNVNGYECHPIEDPKGRWFSQIIVELAHGDSREGVIIKKGDDEIYLTYGANRRGSNAQSMAIGYLKGDKYFFIDECFRDIYDENPIVSSRSMVKCDSLWEESKNIMVKPLMNIYNSRLKVEIDNEEEREIEELASKIENIKNALTKESLRNLRKKEIMLRKKLEARKITARDDDER